MKINPYSADFLSNPYPHYAHMRAFEPITSIRGFRGTDWLLSRHDDIRFVLVNKNAEVDNLPARLRELSERTGASSLLALADTLDDWLFFLPAVAQPRVRRALAPAFSKSCIETFRGEAHNVLDELMMDLRGWSDIDLIEQIAKPLPFKLTCRFLGIREADVAHLTVYMSEIFEVFRQPMGLAGYTHIGERLVELESHLQELVATRANVKRDGILYNLLDSSDSEQALSTREILSLLVMFFAVGQDTTQNLLGNACFNLAESPASMDIAIGKRDNIASVVDELSRYDTPVQLILRRAINDIRIGDTNMTKGDRLYLFIGSALRDESVFDEPDRINFDRERSSNLSFGAGIHFCLGAQLARMAAEVTLTRLLNIPGQRFSLLDPEPPRIKHTHVRGFRTLPLRMKFESSTA